jgi:hypothetical protein
MEITVSNHRPRRDGLPDGQPDVLLDGPEAGVVEVRRRKTRRRRFSSRSISTMPGSSWASNPSTRPERRHRRHHQADLPHRRPDEAARGRGPRRHGRRDAEELSAPSGCAAPESRQWAAREPRSWLQGPSSTPTPISVDDHRRARGGTPSRSWISLDAWPRVRFGSPAGQIRRRRVLRGPDQAPAKPDTWRCYVTMLMARAMMRTPTVTDMASSAIIISLAQGVIGDTSVGLNAIAVENDRCK